MTELFDSLDLTPVEAAIAMLWMLVIAAAGTAAWTASGERRAVIAIPGGSTLGLLSWLFFTNVFGYVLRVGPASIAATMLVVACGVLLGLRNRRGGMPRGVSRTTAVSVVVLTLTIGLSSTFITARSLMYDDREPSHIGSSQSMVYTAYPPLEPERPTREFEYHYAPETFSAALLDVAGIPVWRGYDIQILLFASAAAALAFAACFLLSARLGAARPAVHGIFGLALGTLGAGWRWTAAFRDADPGLASKGFTTDAFVNNMHTKSVAIGLPALLLVVILTALAFDDVRSRGQQLFIAAATTITLATFALSAETYLAMAVPLLVMSTLVFAIRRRSIAAILRTAPAWLAAVVIARFQGGVLSTKGGVTTSEESFQLSEHLFHVPTFYLGWIPAWGTEFLLEWLPLLVVALPAIVVLAFKRRDPFAIGGMAMAIVALAVPLLLVYPHHPPEIVRFLPVATLVLSLLAAATLASAWTRRSGWTGRAVVLCVTASLLATSASFLYQGVLYGEEYLTGSEARSARLGLERGAPNLSADQLRDLRALRKLPYGALVAGPLRNDVTLYSGRLPVLSSRDPEANERLERVLRTGRTDDTDGWYPVDYVYCDTGASEPCKTLNDIVLDQDLDLEYRRTGPNGTAFIVEADLAAIP